MNLQMFTFIIVAILLTSCKNIPQQQIQTAINQTPDMFENKSVGEEYSLTKRYQDDVISRLFKEATDKDIKLKELYEHIIEMEDLKQDSLKDYKKYERTNENYWVVASKYVKQIKDTLLRESTLKIFEKLELEYRNKMLHYDHTIESIGQRTIALSDQLLLMKLLITESMMKNYQINERPNIKTLEHTIEQYDKIIEETKKYTQISKK